MFDHPLECLDRSTLKADRLVGWIGLVADVQHLIAQAVTTLEHPHLVYALDIVYRKARLVGKEIGMTVKYKGLVVKRNFANKGLVDGSS